jgi:hypothetical protein
MFISAPSISPEGGRNVGDYAFDLQYFLTIFYLFTQSKPSTTSLPKNLEKLKEAALQYFKVL